MRITFGTKYNQMTNNQGALSQKLNDVNTKIASGIKIQHGWQDSSLFNQDLGYGYDENTLSQGIDIAKSAHTNTLNTDKSLVEVSKAMSEFKTKLLQAANEIHTPTSRNAIANDLQAIKDHIINIGNTSIGGNFIFGGSKIGSKPFDSDGNYLGNDEELKALISSNNQVPYNITGKELFLGHDSDKYRQITTNLKLINQSKLHPAVMDKVNRSDEPSEVFIKDTDTIRDLIGDDDNDTSNDEKEYFYIRGVRSNGDSFKDKFELDKGYTNPKNATKVRDLLDRIGKSFGNTNATKVVEVKLNYWGQIEIKDLKSGSSSIDFNMISSDKNVDDISELASSGSRVKVYNTQNLRSDFSLSEMQSVNNQFDKRVITLPTTLIAKDNSLASANSQLEDVLNENTAFLQISGTPPNNKDGSISNEILEPLIFETKGKKVRDLLDAIKDYFGGNIDVELDKGQINIYDKHVKNTTKDLFEPPFDGPHGLSVKVEGLDGEGNSIKSFSDILGMDYTKVFFKNDGRKIYGNIPQSKGNGSELATGDTKLSEVAGPLNNQSYTMDVKDHNGAALRAQIHFNQQGSFLELPPKKRFSIDKDGVKTENASIKIPLFNPKDEPPAVTISEGNNVTYRQFMDALSIALNYSNETEEALKKAQLNGGPTQANKDAYNELLSRAGANLSIDFDIDGKIEIEDNIRSETRMGLAVFSNDSDDFSENAIKNVKSNIRINANSSLVIDDPKVSFFKGLDEAISAVRNGIDRPGALNGENYNDNMQNKGIQNSLTLVDHLSDHIEKIVAKNGAHSRTFENAVTRGEVIKAQVSGIKGDTIGTDIAETYNQFNNLSNNYQAVLASTNKINQLSLVDYLK